MMRELLLAAVRTRVERFRSSSDPAAVLDPAALAEVAALVETTADVDVDVEVRWVAGWLHWCRYLALDPGADQHDFLAAARLLEPIYRELPDAVPDPIREFLDAAGPGTATETEATAEVAVELLRRALGSGDNDELDLAIDSLRRLLDTAPPAHPGRADWLSNLCLALWTRFERSSEIADLQAAVAAGRQAADASAPGQPGRAAILSNLSTALTRWYEQRGVVADLDEAVTTGQGAVEATRAGDQSRSAALGNLSTVLLTRYGVAGAPADLAAAVTAGRQAVDATPPGHPGRALRLAGLGQVLRVRYEHSGALADLEEAITAGRQALDAAPPGDPARPAVLANLGSALTDRFDRQGDLADLDAAITAGRHALDEAPARHPDRPRMLANLAADLAIRFGRTGDLSDLDGAITAGQQAVAEAPAGHTDLGTMLSNLSGALLRRFERTEMAADLDAAVAAGRDATEAAPADHPNRAAMLSHLSNALRHRFKRMGAIADIDEAVATGRRAVVAALAGHPNQAASLSNLGTALAAKFNGCGTLSDLDEAIMCWQDAARISRSDQSARAVMLTNLGRALINRFERAGAPADLDRAMIALREAAANELAPPLVRAVAAQGWGWTAGVSEQWLEAAAGYEKATALLGMLAPRSLARDDQEYLLEELDGLASQAAGCCIRAGQAGRAVELLEQGRGVLLGQALDARTDLTKLAAAHPGLAERFAALRDDLDRAQDSPVHQVLRPSATGHGADETEAVRLRAERRRETVRAFDQVIEDIRAKPGFDRFLRPALLGDLAAAAAEGPVVIVNVSRFGSHALIVTADGVQEPLPLNVTPDQTVERVTSLLAEFDPQHGAAATGTRGSLEDSLMDTLRWLWDTIAGPVLEQLGFTAPPEDGQTWPRLWWCTPGLLAFLPLHAAGYHETRSDPLPQTVADRVVSSHTPTIRALIHARRARTVPDASAPPPGQEILVVAMPYTPHAPALRGAQAEADTIHQLFPGQTDILTGARATREAVTGELPAARWAHFACHGYTNLDDPSAGRLLLHDHLERPFTVLDVSKLRVKDADLAYLSACSTARATGRLTDEAIHLASAFQIAGYRHVIGTLWPVNDRVAVDLARDLYTALARTGTASTAATLHAVTRGQRNRRPQSPSAWASHIHIGP